MLQYWGRFPLLEDPTKSSYAGCWRTMDLRQDWLEDNFAHQLCDLQNVLPKKRVRLLFL